MKDEILKTILINITLFFVLILTIMLLLGFFIYKLFYWLAEIVILKIGVFISFIFVIINKEQDYE